MVVDDTARLHRGVHRRRADEAEARCAQTLCERRRRGRRSEPVGVATAAPSGRGEHPARRARPAAFPPHATPPSRARSRSSPRSCPGGGRSRRPRAAASTSRFPNRRDRFGVEPAERLAERIALAQDRQPREPRLEALERQPFVETSLVAHRPTPLLVVVGDVERVGGLPAANQGCTSATTTITTPSSDDDLVRVDGLERRQRERPSRAQVERRPVPGADHATGVLLPFALAERAVVVRAPILEGEELAAAVVDADRGPADGDDLHRPGPELGQRCDVNLGH